jgi:RNA polymerase primary sigma factor
MASNSKMTPLKEEVPEKEGSEIRPDGPLLDFSDAAIKQLIRSAKKRGYVTHVQINELLSSEEVKSEQIEDILAKLSEMGVNVVETEEAEAEDEGAGEEAETQRGAGQSLDQRTHRAHRRPRAHVSARNELGGTPFARG